MVRPSNFSSSHPCFKDGNVTDRRTNDTLKADHKLESSSLSNIHILGYKGLKMGDCLQNSLPIKCVCDQYKKPTEWGEGILLWLLKV